VVKSARNKKRAKSRQKSHYNYTGPLREKIVVKARNLPTAHGCSKDQRRRKNFLSPKNAKSKFQTFAQPRDIATAGGIGIGIGLDDYLFNTSKMTFDQTPRKTKASDSQQSRPEERNSTFLWSRGSS
jgi:hypothetical protein